MGRIVAPLLAWVAFSVVGWGVLVPGSAGAQPIPESDCDLADFRVLASEEPAPGERVTRVGGPDVLCEDGTRLRADSAVIRQAAAVYEFLGDVHYEGPDQELLADRADYFEGDERLFARGEVTLHDRAGESEIRGDTLELLLVGELREEEDLTVWGDRATALLPPDDPSEEDGSGSPETGDAEPDSPAPYRIVANWMRFEGERSLEAQEQVEVERDGMRAFSDRLTFDRVSGELELIGSARLEADEATFSGARIFVLMPDDELRSVTVHEEGHLIAEDLEVLGEEIRVTVENELIQRLVSVDRWPTEEDPEENGDAEADPEEVEPRPEEAVPDPDDEEAEAVPPAGDRPPRPHVITEEFFLAGDSIDVRSPDEVLETIDALGEAWGETRRAGTPPPDPFIRPSSREVAPGEGLGALDRDWVEGDRIVATFAPAPAPEEVEGEDDTPEYVLESLVATGAGGALYRSPPDDRPEDAPEPTEEERRRWAVSYVLADEIVVALLDGRMDRVEAEGDLRGVQLEPLEESDDPDEEEPDDEAAPDDPEEPA